VGHVGMYGFRLLLRAIPPHRGLANLKTMAAAMREMAHTAAQKGVQDRLVSKNVHDAIKSIYQRLRGSRSKEVRTQGTCWNSVCFDLRTKPDSKA
jgi:hypothetical protein